MHLIKQQHPFSAEELAQMGLEWCDAGYIAPELVQVSNDEAEAYYEAALRCYEMFCEAAEHVIAEDLFFEMGIPFNLVDLIKESWANDVHWHVYGRFDFAGGLDGEPIRLLEFNANTPTSLVESGFVQYEQLRREGLDENMQFNHLFEALELNFKRVICQHEDPALVSEIPYKMLFSCVKDSEEEATMRYLMSCAQHAGWNVEFAYIEDVEFGRDGIFVDGCGYEYLFTLLPWEVIATEEPELCNLLSRIVNEHRAIVLNPAYTLLFQSKAILSVLHELFPDEPLILPASLQPLPAGVAQVSKPFFGREGANVTICNERGEVVAKSNGDFSGEAVVYQQFATLNRHENCSYQAGVFYAYEPCALGFRRSDANEQIIGNKAQFVGHYLKG